MKHLASVLLAASMAATCAADGGDALFDFWSGLFEGHVKAEHWADSPGDPPEVVEAKELLRGGLGQVLATCEWKPAREHVRLQTLDRGPDDHIRVGLYADGDVWYLGFVAREGAGPFRAFMPERRHMYDVLPNRYAGYDVGRGIQLAPGKPYLMAAYPHKVVGMALGVEPAAAKPGGTVRVSIALAGTETPGLHCFRLRFVGPQGQERKDLDRLVMAEKGEATVGVNLPKGLPPGPYSVSARCAITAVIAAEVLHVEP